MLTSIAAVVLSAHFGRVLAGNIYRACPAFVLPAEQLCSMLGYFKDGATTVDEAGNQHVSTVPDTARVTLLERCRFFAHCLLAN